MDLSLPGLRDRSEHDRTLFEAALAGADDALLIAELDGTDLGSARIVFVNHGFTRVTGHEAGDAIGRSPLVMLDAFTDDAFDVQRQSLDRTTTVEHLLRRRDGSPYWAEVTFGPLGGASRSHVVGTIRDVDDRHRAYEMLAHAATHDALTGLPNRVLLLERLDDAIGARAETAAEVAVLFIDLDHFKLINDSLGHVFGDLVLREAAERLVACIGTGDTVGRFGGDELVVVHAPVDGDSAVLLAESILAAMSEPMTIADRELVVSASVGVATSSSSHHGSDQLLRDADTALYSAKERGRGRLEVFSAGLYERVIRRVELESDLRVALRERQLFLDYQPFVDLSTGRLVGVEALVRWRHPAHGVVPPADFIPVAEETGLITQVGRLVLEESCRQFAEWKRTLRNAPPSITVNVSLLQLDEAGFVDELTTILEDSGIEPSALCLELTESALMQSGADAVEVLDRLRKLGVYIGIDDFGTEYSSLARLRDLPIEVLKIDRTFVDGLGTEPGDTAIVASIMSLAAAMGLHVIAEGIEQEAQAVALAGMGCGVGQGYYFSRPVAAERIAELVDERLWRPPAPRAPVGASALVVPSPDAGGRRGRRWFVDEFLDHIGAPMDDAEVGR